MKKVLNLITFIMCFHITSFAQIPNASFENLDSTNAMQNWIYTGAIYVTIGDSIITDGPLISASTDAHTGMYALELRNSYNYTSNTPFMNGAVTSTIPDTTMYQGFNPKLPLLNKPYSLNFYYKLSQNPFNDSCICTVKIFNNDNEEIGNGKSIFWDVNAAYQLKNVAINYLPTTSIAIGDSIPATYTIDFKNKMSTTTQNVGQHTLIDDVSFDFSPLSVSSIQENYHSTIYPNPINNVLKIEGKNITNVEVFNAIGELILSNQKTVLNLQSIPSGIYFLKIDHNKNVEITKFIKE